MMLWYKFVDFCFVGVIHYAHEEIGGCIVALDQKCSVLHAMVSVAFVTVHLGVDTAFKQYVWCFSFSQHWRITQRDLPEGGVMG